ncbi:MAG: peptidoglycan-binding protein [Gemmatimonadales bacterium]|nr:peptidoglycan-binding protein [Gemmatimonadales bacterium]
MADRHQVGPGEHLFRIAHDSGFRTIRPLTEEPANAELLRRRVNPATLIIGDEVAVPAFEAKEAQGSTGRVNTFTLAGSGLFLNLRIQSTERRPLANRAFRLVLAEVDPAGPKAREPETGVTGAKGDISAEISIFDVEGELIVRATDAAGSRPIETIKLLVGLLDPPNTIRGQQVRLNNMGYFAGFSEQDLVQLKWAIEEFQADHGLKATGRTDDPVTFNRIAHEHGDLLPNEKVP